MPKARRGGGIEAQRERADETRAMLMKTARIMFAQLGYHATTTEALAVAARVTQGSLYHHFSGKKALFEAVFREVLLQAHRDANARALSAGADLWSQVLHAFDSYLTIIAASGEFQKVVLIDGPAVFGWVHWRDLQAEFSSKPVGETLKRLMDEGVVGRQPEGPLASLLMAALNDAALTIAHSDDPEQARSQVARAFMSLLEGIRIRS